ncbi:MAG: hypothetical protein HC802_06065 [Caldilineaceae bacterium]|nr:hypothetical protein [Caldilineaceae bacterium]
MKSLQFFAAATLILLGVILLMVTITSRLEMSRATQMWTTLLACGAALLFLVYESLGERPYRRDRHDLRRDVSEGWAWILALLKR